jgi:molybdopterin-guanine dinucleotide biosynthesis protein B
MHELRDEEEPPLSSILERMSPADIVIVEGYKREGHRKIETRRREARSREPLSATDPGIVAVASDGPQPLESLPVFALDDITAIADFVERSSGLTTRP